jgi:RTX calcium-binding nonapeptide repeat (4 copies)
MRQLRTLTLVVGLAWLAVPGVSLANHVSVSPAASALLGKRISDTTWQVKVSWAVNCSGPAPGHANYFGNLYLVDSASGEEYYLGGVSSAGGDETINVRRKVVDRHLYPRLKASCAEDAAPFHGSDTKEIIGGSVTVPRRGFDGGRPGAPSGGQGRRDFPHSGFGTPTDPLRGGACALMREGTSGADTLNGTGDHDLLLGLGGNDVLRGRAGHDCLIGGPGRDRLYGQGGYDRLTGGAGADRLVGGSGVDRFDAGSGNDFVDARDGKRELVSCGRGRDTARVDKRDRVRHCERVRRK